MPIRVARPDDFDAVAAFLVACSRDVHGVAEIDAGVLRVAWALPGFDVERDSWIAENDGVIVGYAAVGAGGALTLAAPDFAVATALLDAAQERARERGESALQILVTAHDRATTDAIASYGFEGERSGMRMWVGLTDLPARAALPNGITLRTYDASDAASVHALLDRAYETWDTGYVRVAHEDWVAWMTNDPEFDPTVWFLAERDGRLVGCSLWWSSGWLKDVGVELSARGNGLGRALVLHGLRELAARGIASAGLKVDSSNPSGAIALYESLGFTPVRVETLWSFPL
jgi:ribosomal protein S18 acetylase RimI-like enzyme